MENGIKNLSKNNNIILKKNAVIVIRVENYTYDKIAIKVSFPKGTVSRIIGKFEKYKEVLLNIHDNAGRSRTLKDE